MIEINPWLAIGTIATVIILIISLMAMYFNNKMMRAGFKKLSELVELEKKKRRKYG